MNSKTKANSTVTHRLIEGILYFTVIGQEEMAFDPKKAARGNRDRAESHGWIQRITDLAALPTTDKDGVLIPRDERLRRMHERMNSVIAHYEAGSEDWSRKVSAKPEHSLVIRALMELYSMTHEAVQEFITGKAKALNVSRNAVLGNFADSAKVKAKMESLRGPLPEIGEEELFSGLEGGEEE